MQPKWCASLAFSAILTLACIHAADKNLKARPSSIPSFVDRGPWVGAVTPTSAVVKVRLAAEGAMARLSLGEAGTNRAILFTEPQTAPASRIVAFELKKLKPLTHYFYNVEAGGRFERATLGQFTTFPAGAASFTFAYASCARTASSHPVFRTIRENHPLFFMNIGDFHYLNITTNNPAKFRAAYDLVLSSPQQGDLYRHIPFFECENRRQWVNINTDSTEKFYAAYDEVLLSPLQSELYRNVPFVYIWDDHDYGGNNSSRTAGSHSAARLVYQDYVPHYPLPAGSGDVPIYQAFTVGRAHFILTDLRSERTPDSEKDTPQKTMLGMRQKEWFKKELLSANGLYPLIFWVTTVPWIGTAGVDFYPAETNLDGAVAPLTLPPRAQQQFSNRKRDPWLDDYWAGFAYERREIADFIKQNKIRALCILHGDAHMLAADNGTHSDYAAGGGAALPVLAAAPLDQDGSIKGGPYSQGVYKPMRGEGCFGLVTVLDRDDHIRVVYSGRNHFNHEKIGLIFEVPAAATTNSVAQK